MENENIQQPTQIGQQLTQVQQPTIKPHKTNNTKKVIVGVLMPVLFLCGFGLGFLTHSIVSKSDTVEQDDKDETGSNPSKDTTTSTSGKDTESGTSNTTKLDKVLQRVDVNGMSIADACATAREAGWRIESVLNEDTYASGSCASDGIVVNIYYYEYEDSTDYGGIKLYYR